MPEIYDVCTPILFGHAGTIQRLAALRGLHCPPVILVDELPAAHASAIVDVGQLDPAAVHPGAFSAATGRASFDAVCAGIDAAAGAT